MPFPFITKPAPAFTSTALMPNKEFKEISLSDYRGKWVVFFWYPLDFTFVCPTEIIAFGDRADEFAAINTQVIGASCDSQFTHLAWVNTPRSEGGLGDMKIPIIADFTKKVATDYGVLVPDAGIPFRAVFIINPEGVLRQITVNDLPVGRNVDEIIRLIKAFQFVDEHGEVCPANWQPGDLTMKADPNASKEYFHAANAGAAAAGGAKTAYVEITDKAGFSAATSSAGLTVVDYWAPWCKNCSKIAPAVDNLAASLAGTKFVKVNTNLAVDLAAENGVGSLPSFQFFKGGKKVGEYTGSNVTSLEAAIKSHL